MEIINLNEAQFLSSLKQGRRVIDRTLSKMDKDDVQFPGKATRRRSQVPEVWSSSPGHVSKTGPMRVIFSLRSIVIVGFSCNSQGTKIAKQCHSCTQTGLSVLGQVARQPSYLLMFCMLNIFFCHPAAVAWSLHRNLGFPLDLIELMLEERDMTMDKLGVEKLTAAQEKVSASWCVV